MPSRRRFLRPAAALLLLGAQGAGAAEITVSTRAFLLRDDTQPPISQSLRKFSYTSRTLKDPLDHRVVRPAFGSAGDPTVDGATGGGAVMTIYNATGSGESFTYALPALKWQRGGSDATGRFVYIDNQSQPVYRVYVKHDKLTIRGGRGAWAYSLNEPSQGALAVRLTLGTGDTWCVQATPKFPATTFDHQDRFQAQTNTPAPALCPPTP